MHVISSFGPEGWQAYGKKFLDSFLANWPCDITIYYEEKPDYEHPRVHWVDLLALPTVADYLKFTGSFPALRGLINGKRYYQFDLFRFCRKSFAQFHAAATVETDKLFWLDADVETFKPVPEALLNGFLDDVYMCYLGREDWHSCASFIGWNLRHPDNDRFMPTYMNVYLSGDIFRLKEWHDSYVVDQVRQATKVSARNLTLDIKTEGPANIFDLSPLGQYAHHDKGPGKYVTAGKR